MLARGIRRGGESYSIQCFRHLGERGDVGVLPFLLPFLTAERAATRRAAAACVGNLGLPGGAESLLRGMRAERTDTGMLAFAVAAVRCGADPVPLEGALVRHDARSVMTDGGLRAPGAAAAVTPLAALFWSTLGDGAADVRQVVPRPALRQRRLAACANVPDPSSGVEPEAGGILALALLQHPDDTRLLLEAERDLGRRAAHTRLLALGRTGDPLVIPTLLAALRARDVDPARGFTQRRLAALGLGVVGLRETTPPLLAAISDEKHDFEGRPGAGLGIQFPVRSAIYWALGEIADERAISALVAVLDDTHGSAFGGFYLPAMDALIKIGVAAVPALRRVAAHGSDVARANASGALAAIETARPC